jgi:hypothetical protein
VGERLGRRARQAVERVGIPVRPGDVVEERAKGGAADLAGAVDHDLDAGVDIDAGGHRLGHPRQGLGLADLVGERGLDLDQTRAQNGFAVPANVGLSQPGQSAPPDRTAPGP